MIVILLTINFFLFSCAERCQDALIIDSGLTFPHHQRDRLIAPKIIKYGANSSISCLITNKTADEFNFKLKRNFRWIFRPLYPLNGSDIDVHVNSESNIEQIFKYTSGTFYTKGLCNELKIHRFSHEAVGIYTCVPKVGYYYTKAVKVEIFVDDEQNEPKLECPDLTYFEKFATPFWESVFSHKCKTRNICISNRLFKPIT